MLNFKLNKNLKHFSYHIKALQWISTKLRYDVGFSFHKENSFDFSSLSLFNSIIFHPLQFPWRFLLIWISNAVLRSLPPPTPPMLNELLMELLFHSSRRQWIISVLNFWFKINLMVFGVFSSLPRLRSVRLMPSCE